ncbi:unnamed protein product [Gongylonema pulchrum]|uniref:Acyltransf_C domain-containing protein n=1 Tax=Gongylonema pulchrum TaxID=637853 RepID=A0A183DFR9_9BILA|nr:unnamed protein product [Gongylonema pulchrum]
MVAGDYVKNVYDVTVGYSDGIVSSELEILLKGRFPHSVHFDIKWYKENELPSDEHELAIWLTKLWNDKEHRLEKFYKADITERMFLPSGKKHVWPELT